MADADFATMMALEAHGPDTYVGAGRSYPWGGLYGGQIVAQALRAAGLTVDPSFSVHSLHAFFIRRGDAAEPIRFEVDRIRNGRSFVTRRVEARQSVGAILTMAASFQVDEPAPDAQMATLPGGLDDPGTHQSLSWSPLFDRVMLRPPGPGRSLAWLRMTDDVGADPLLHACALAYLSDDLPTDAAVSLHPRRQELGDADEAWWCASLDHAIWFHRPLPADEWHLYDFTCHGLMRSRGLSVGHVFTPGGTHVATVAQEVLVREAQAR